MQIADFADPLGIVPHVYDAIETGVGKRDQSMLWAITTHSSEINDAGKTAVVDPLRLAVGTKGETHTATLVVDSYFRSHHLLTLKPWLLGQRAGKQNEGPQNQSRLKQHYVAMTRPTTATRHLLHPHLLRRRWSHLLWTRFT